MRTLLLFVAALSFAPATAASAAQNATASAAQSPTAEETQLQAAIDLAHGGRPAEALPLLDKVIAASEARYRGPVRDIYCARGLTDTMMYMTQSAAAKRNAVAIETTWCDALFLKGFVLVDLKRPAEARQWIEKAVAMAPRNAHYRNELAEGYKAERNWTKAYALFEQAAEDAKAFSPEDVKKAELGRALRGMAFVRVETGDFHQAQKLIEQALELDPNDLKARNELQFIAEQRAAQAVN